MINTTYPVYAELDPKKKTAEWANGAINQLRMYWRPLVDINKCRRNKNYLFGLQDMEKIKKSFKDKRFIAETDFEPIDVMFNIRNTLTEEILKSPPKAEVRAVDPLAMSDREKDIQMLKSRKILEADISQYNQQIGLPAYKMPYDFFKGNVKDFDQKGLNPDDPDDVSLYQNNFQRLDYEIASQQVVNNVMKIARFDEDIAQKMMIDILANNVNCTQTFVNKITGEIKVNYVYPEIAYSIANDSNDGHNDIAKGWQDTKTIQEFLEMAGNEFDWNKDWPKLLWALNYFNGYKYTGFIRNGVNYNAYGDSGFREQAGVDQNWQQAYIDWSLAYTYKVFVGYIEWNTCEATGSYAVKEGNPSMSRPVGYDYELSEKEVVDSYQKETYYQQQWYSSSFICTSAVSQWIFNFGKVYYQELEGANDEYSAGTLKYYMKEGRSAVDIAVPYIDFVNFTFYRLRWLIWHAKPEEDVVVMEELIQIAKGLQRMYPQSAKDAKSAGKELQQILKQVITFQRENFIRLRSYPQVDGKTVAQLPQTEGKRNGLDNLASQMLQIEQWAESKIGELIGINAMRLGANPQSRESFNSEQATLQASVNTTGYMYRMIQFVKQRAATTSVIFAQDILNFKDSIPYKWLSKILGYEMFVSLSVLNNVVAHRYGIFISDYNSNMDKADLKQAATIALNQKMINIDGWALVTQTEDPKLGLKMLSFLQAKTAKKARQQQLQDSQIQDQLAQNEFQRQMQILQAQGAIEKMKSENAANASIEVAQIQAGSRITVKRIGEDSKPNSEAAKTQSQIEINKAKENDVSQNALPVAAG